MLNIGSFTSFFLLSSSVVFSLLASDFLVLWLVMEFNLVFFIYWVYFQSSSEDSSSFTAIVYFLVQSISSLSIFWLLFILPGESAGLGSLGFALLFLKIGLFPFHYWVLSLASCLTKMGFFVVMIPQKVIPMLMLRFSAMSVSLVLINLVASVYLSYTENGTANMLVYSSLFNFVWVLLCLYAQPSTALMFYGGYALVFASLICSLGQSFNDTLSHMMSSSAGEVSQVSVLVGFLSMAGFPVTLGFYLKIMIILGILSFNFVLAVSLIVFSLMMVYLYLRILLPQLLKSSSRYWGVTPRYALKTSLPLMLNLFPAAFLMI